MSSVTTPATETVTPSPKGATRRQIRGSSLLLAGRALSMVVNAMVQIMIVRYLSKSSYGAFAYALSVVNMGEMIVSLGLDRAVTRFVPIYHEQRDYNKMFGTIIVALSTMLSLGLAIVLLVFGFQGIISQQLVNDRQAITLLLILIALAPIQALDGLMIGMFSIFAGSRAIFFRKYVLAPGLRLAVVLLLMLGHSDVYFLAGGYVATGVIGLAMYGVILIRLLHKQGLFKHFKREAVTFPAGALFAFTIPLLTTDLLYILMNTMDAVLLGRYGTTSDVAAFRSVQTAAGLNQLAMTSFQLLFTPQAARLFAREDYDGINHLYWQTAVWMAVIGFPLFAITFSLAQPLTLLLFGADYASSAPILALLSLAYYFSAALGFNGLTIRVFGSMRYLVAINLIAALVNLGVNLLLIPRYGAVGAAVGTCSTIVVHNILKQLGLRFVTKVNPFDWHYLRVFLPIVPGALGLLALQIAAPTHVFLSFTLAALISFAVFFLNRRLLDVANTFPELLRFPILRRFLT